MTITIISDNSGCHVIDFRNVFFVSAWQGCQFFSEVNHAQNVAQSRPISVHYF